MKASARTLRWLVLFTLVAGAVAQVVTAQAPVAPAPPPGAERLALTQTIPVDPLITVGTLPNGLRYYVRPNQQPRGRAELRLVVKAGSVLEDDDQRGLAHFVEHMAFNGSQHFPQQAIATFMQGIGMRFGAHVNAHTGFDETVYELQIPSGDSTVIEQALLMMEDWARGVSFEPAEIEKERGVILEEWRQGLGADGRMQNIVMPVLLQGSRYAVRSPIGTPDTIRNAPHARLKQFYADWYRPDLMAVIVVGDFDRAAMEGRIKAHFGPIPAATSPRPRAPHDVPSHPGTLYVVATDREATATTVGVIGKMPARDQRTVGVYRQQMAERLFAGMLSERLDELARTPNAPFQAARSSRGLFVRTMEATTMQALVAEGGAARGLTALVAEADRVARYGFTATELERQKVSSQRYLQQALAEKNTTPSAPLADEFIRNFMNDEPIPGIIYEQAMAQRLMPGITLEELNRLAATWVPDANRVVVVNAPQKAGTTPTAETLAAALKSANTRPLSAYVDVVNSAPLLDPLPAPGAIARTTSTVALGITEWRLSNGVRVILKPTDFKADEVLFRAVSPGGTSLASDADFVAARTAEAVMAESGLGRLSRLDLTKALATVNTFVGADISDAEEGLGGGAARKDLETMFQLIHLTFTAPRADATAFGVLTANLKRSLANRQAEPEAAFDEAVTSALTGDHPRARPLTPALVDQMSLERSLAFYRDRYSDASDFTFVFVGSFDLPTMKPLVERYLASLPARGRVEAARDVGIRTPTTVVRREVRKGVEPKSQVSIVFTGAFDNTEANRLLVSTMAATLSGNLHRTLREDLGGTYGVSVEPAFGFHPRQEYRVSISFGCDPARVETLVAAAWQVISEFKAAGPGRGQLADAKLAAQRDFETNARQNPYWLTRLTQAYEQREDVATAIDPRPLYDQLTPIGVRDAARRFLDESRYVQVILRPEVP